MKNQVTVCTSKTKNKLVKISGGILAVLVAAVTTYAFSSPTTGPGESNSSAGSLISRMAGDNFEKGEHSLVAISNAVQTIREKVVGENGLAGKIQKLELALAGLGSNLGTNSGAVVPNFGNDRLGVLCGSATQNTYEYDHHGNQHPKEPRKNLCARGKAPHNAHRIITNIEWNSQTKMNTIHYAFSWDCHNDRALAVVTCQTPSYSRDIQAGIFEGNGVADNGSGKMKDPINNETYTWKKFTMEDGSEEIWLTQNIRGTKYEHAVYGNPHKIDDLDFLKNEDAGGADVATEGYLYSRDHAGAACPPGWRLADVSRLCEAYGGTEECGFHLKSTDVVSGNHGYGDELKSSNSSGFNVLMAGLKGYSGSQTGYGRGRYAQFWTESSCFGFDYFQIGESTCSAGNSSYYSSVRCFIRE